MASSLGVGHWNQDSHVIFLAVFHRQQSGKVEARLVDLHQCQHWWRRVRAASSRLIREPKKVRSWREYGRVICSFDVLQASQTLPNIPPDMPRESLLHMLFNPLWNFLSTFPRDAARTLSILLSAVRWQKQQKGTFGYYWMIYPNLSNLDYNIWGHLEWAKIHWLDIQRNTIYWDRSAYRDFSKAQMLAKLLGCFGVRDSTSIPT